ncbi:glycerophosphodiester phosphodiesterase [Flavobacterium sp. RSB2_4_14]|uniref:glycerophosphodiester phosphodiesterase n=1 Tax=Flavobacterium sp. RSB2_4_14 TaxID=3447665 RepID=UPI003F38DF53
MIKIGHRGAKGYVAENTLASFEKALQLSVDMIELDVFLSKDNIPVVIHDKTIDRTTSGFGLVSSFSASELQLFGIPTLQDVFQLVNNQCEINVEIKEFEAVKSVLDLIDSNIFSKVKILISSFDWNALQEIRFHDDEIRIGVLTETDLELAIAFAKFIQAYSIHPYYHLLTSENCQKMKNNHFKIFTWTVNELEDIIFVKSFNVDGIITDFPDRI